MQHPISSGRLNDEHVTRELSPKASDRSHSGVRLRSRPSSPPPRGGGQPRTLAGGVGRRARLLATAIAVVLSAIVATAVSAALARLLVL